LLWQTLIFQAYLNYHPSGRHEQLVGKAIPMYTNNHLSSAPSPHLTIRYGETTLTSASITALTCSPSSIFPNSPCKTSISPSPFIPSSTLNRPSWSPGTRCRLVSCLSIYTTFGTLFKLFPGCERVGAEEKRCPWYLAILCRKGSKALVERGRERAWMAILFHFWTRGSEDMLLGLR
jgi:hypothetical protein